MMRSLLKSDASESLRRIARALVALVALCILMSPRIVLSANPPTEYQVKAALILNFRVMPQIVRIGRTRDFQPRDPSSPDYRRFRKLHASFTSIDGLKWLAGIAALIRLIVLRW